jgi:PAS domain S-box-containing protein
MYKNVFISFSRNILLTAVLLIPLVLAFIVYVKAEKRIDRANDMRHASFLLADELRHSSDDLTRMARTYVVTGEARYKRQYQAILDIRDGQKPRPDGYSRIYWDLVLNDDGRPRPDTTLTTPLLELMRQADFSPQELAKLTEAKLNSDNLALIEIEAMKLAESHGSDAEANRARARTLMYDQRYHQAKAAIMKPIYDFYVMMDKRTEDAVRTAENRALALRFLFVAFALWLIYMLWRTYKVLRTTLGGTVDEVYTQIARIGSGDFSPVITASEPQGASVMGRLGEMRDKLDTIDNASRKAQEALRESEEKYRILFRDSPDAYLIIMDGMFVDCNRATEIMLRGERTQIVGQPPELLSPEFQPDGRTSSESAEEKIKDALQSGSSSFQWVHRRLDGTDFFVDVSIASILLDGKLALFTTWRDITERKQVELELLNKNEELERFTYTVSHDLKSPLITIQTYAGMIKKDMESGNLERARDDIRRVENSAAKMTELLNDLLELSRIGRKMNEPSRIDMNLLVQGCLTHMDGLLKQKQITVVVQEALPELFGDRHRMYEVMQNLIENAAKYTGDQSAPRIEIGTRFDGVECVIFVSDNGKGIEPRFHENIFGLFNKLDARSEGTGVGLALVKRIIEVHGGRIWVESEGGGHGSRFCFTLPAPLTKKESHQ